MTDLPRCWNCRFAEEAHKYKSADEYESAKDFMLCRLSNCFMYRFDYCTQHPDIQLQIERLKNANKS